MPPLEAARNMPFWQRVLLRQGPPAGLAAGNLPEGLPGLVERLDANRKEDLDAIKSTLGEVLRAEAFFPPLVAAVAV